MKKKVPTVKLKLEPRPLVKEALDFMTTQGCQVPNCPHNHALTEPLYLHARCHPDAGAAVSYTYGTGILMIECNACHKEIAQVAIARSH